MVKLTNNEIIHIKTGELEYIQFKALLKYKHLLTHCFSTRRGGVSTGECNTLNLGFNRNDSKENVKQNFEIICSTLGIEKDRLVFSNQVHDNKLQVVYDNDAGKGIVKESDIKGVDGLATSTRGLPIVTFYADCVPVFLYDTKNNAICLVHSGWRSTVLKIVSHAVQLMKSSFGTNPGDIVAAIGPSIGKCCFEVDLPVVLEFERAFNNTRHISKKDRGKSEHCISTGDKYYIALWEVIRDTLGESGVLNSNIHTAGICTVCNNDTFFSHRGDKGKTGSLAAIAQLN